MRLVLLIVLNICANLWVYADVSDTVKIADVFIKDNKTKIHKNKIQIDKNLIKSYQRQNLQQVLQENSAIQFKSYGASGSSLMSIRGANPSHSKVIWNGLNLGSSMLNMNDVSILPVNENDEIEIVRGGSSAEHGTGALSGFVNIQSNFRDTSRMFGVAYNWNSLKNQQTQLKYNFHKNNFYSNTLLLINAQKNKYLFNNYAEFGNPEQEQINSEVQQIAFIQSFRYRKNKVELDLHVWYQENDRNLSPSIFNRNKNSYQLDKSFRSIAHVNYSINENLVLNNSIAYTRERLRFVNRIKNNSFSFVMLNTLSYFDNVQTNSSITFKKNKFQQSFSAQFVFDGANVEDYEKYEIRNRISILSQTEIQQIKNFSLLFNNRIEKGVSDYKEFNYAGSAQLNYSLPFYKAVETFVRVSKNYNIPGLNDLYWVPGGNPNLISEKSIEQELGLKHQFLYKTFKNSLQITVYQSNVRDWILWQPSTIENGIWSPQNLKRVELSGIELENATKWKWNKSDLVLNVFYSKNNAINKEAVSNNDQSVGKQLIYIPLVKWGFNFIYNYKSYTGILKRHFVSHRYTSSDNSSFLNSYALLDIQFQKRINIKKQEIQLNVYIDNILNETYESIPFQVMPARVYGFGFTYQLTK